MIGHIAVSSFAREMGPRQTRRSSGRHRIAVGQYTNDAFQAAGLNSNDQNSGGSPTRQHAAHADSDEEFTLDAEDTRGTSNHDEEGELAEGKTRSIRTRLPRRGTGFAYFNLQDHQKRSLELARSRVMKRGPLRSDAREIPIQAVARRHIFVA